MDARLFYRESLTETFGRYARRLFFASPAILFKLLFLRTYGRSQRSTNQRSTSQRSTNQRSALTTQSAPGTAAVAHQPQQSI